MATTFITLSEAIALLRAHYSAPAPLPTSDPFELILWENVAYLASRARRLEAFTQLKSTVGTTPDAILDAKQVALERVTSHGILKSDFAEKLRECARIAIEQCDGNLSAALRGPRDAAIKTLKLFPGIGEPGAEKILLFAGLHPFLAPDSNVVRVLARLGLIEQNKSYARMYAASRDAAAALTPTIAAMQEVHLLLQQHGQALCKRNTPRCDACPLVRGCKYAREVAGS